MKRIILIFAMVVIVGNSAFAAQKEQAIPAKLDEQIRKLEDLYVDSYATRVGQTFIKEVKVDGRDTTLIVFTIGGFNGGNSHMQYLAAFEPERDENNKIVYYTLVDAMLVGMKGWRQIDEFNVSVKNEKSTGNNVFTIDTMEIGPNDGMCCPTKKAKAVISMRKNRFYEAKK